MCKDHWMSAVKARDTGSVNLISAAFLIKGTRSHEKISFRAQLNMITTCQVFQIRKLSIFTYNTFIPGYAKIYRNWASVCKSSRSLIIWPTWWPSCGRTEEWCLPGWLTLAVWYFALEVILPDWVLSPVPLVLVPPSMHFYTVFNGKKKALKVCQSTVQSMKSPPSWATIQAFVWILALQTISFAFYIAIVSFGRVKGSYSYKFIFPLFQSLFPSILLMGYWVAQYLQVGNNRLKPTLHCPWPRTLGYYMKDELQLKLPVLSRKTYSIYDVLHQFSCCQSALAC